MRKKPGKKPMSVKTVSRLGLSKKKLTGKNADLVIIDDPVTGKVDDVVNSCAAHVLTARDCRGPVWHDEALDSVLSAIGVIHEGRKYALDGNLVWWFLGSEKGQRVKVATDSRLHAELDRKAGVKRVGGQ